ncbi:MAG: IMPACT family protein [Candidatus Izemoplasmataceae bacterium]
MKSIKSNLYNQLSIKRSIFHTYCFQVHSLEMVEEYLHEIKTKHPDANHHCFAYILDKQTIQKYDDDGEPSNTAGLPMIEALKRYDLTDILCIVVRYFGGIKLGGGGLIRAYAKSVSQVLQLATFTVLTPVSLLKIMTPLATGGKYENFIREHTHFIRTEYENDCMIYYVEIIKDHYETFALALTNYTFGQAKITIIKDIETFM